MPQGVCDYLLNAYMGSAEGVYVNLFVPSELHWKIQDMPVRLTQATGYPETETSEIRVEALLACGIHCVREGARLAAIPSADHGQR